jgi:hypothetical protein
MIVVKLDGNSTPVKMFPIVVRLDGSFTCFKPEQYLKAQVSTMVTPGGSAA